MTQVTVPVRPDDPPFMHQLASRTGINPPYAGDANPRKWGILWGDRERCTAHLRAAFHRTDANGDLCQRLILEPEMRSMDGAAWPPPNEHGHMGVGCGASWEAIDPFLKQVIIDMTYQRREEDRLAGRPPITVGFYVNAVCNGMPGMIRNHTSTDVINLDDDRELEIFKRNWLPWVECGVLSELNYDAGVHEQWWGKVSNLIDDQLQRYGIYGMPESSKWTGNVRRHGQGKGMDVASGHSPGGSCARSVLARQFVPLFHAGQLLHGQDHDDERRRGHPSERIGQDDERVVG